MSEPDKDAIGRVAVLHTAHREPQPDTASAPEIHVPGSATQAPVARPFVGRASEMAALRAAVDDAMAGRGRLILLSGDPGVGKSRTAEEVGAYARGRGARVLWGRCYESDGAPPFWPWVQVLRAALGKAGDTVVQALLGDSAPYVVQLIPELRAYLPGLPLPPASVSAEDRPVLFESISAVVRNLARVQPLLIVVDDLQGADQPSVLLLRFIVESLAAGDPVQLLILGCCRTAALEQGALLGDLLAPMASADSGGRVALGGLAAADVARFIEAHTGSLPPQALLSRLCAVTEGNPLFLKECAALVAAQATAEPVMAAMTIPSTLTLILQQRLASLVPACREVLAVASAIGRDVPADILAQVAALEVPAMPIDRVVREAMQRALFTTSERAGTYRFSHALVREALYAQLTPAARPRVHRRIGETLARAPVVEERLAELAHHFFAAGAAEDVVAGARYAQQAAERALSVLAFEEALRQCELGLAALDRLGSGHEVPRCELLLTLGQAQKRAVDTATARATFERAVDLARGLGDAERFARAVLGTRWRKNRGNTEAVGVRLLEEALGMLGARDSVLRSRVLGILAGELLYDPSTQERARALSQEGLAVARRVGDPAALGDALLNWFSGSWRVDNLDERLAAANELATLGDSQGSAEMTAQACLLRARCLFEVGDIPGVQRDVDRYAQFATASRRPSRLYVVAFWRVALAWFTGRFADAQRYAFEALDIGQRAKEPIGRQIFAVQFAFMAWMQGRLTAESRQAAAPTLKNDFAWNWAIRSALVIGSVDVGDSDARAQYEDLAAHDFADVPDDMNRMNSWGNIAMLCWRLRDARRAALVYPQLLPFKDRNFVSSDASVPHGAGTRYLGLLAATAGWLDVAAQHFEEAIAHNTRMGARPFCALSQCEYARTLMERNVPGDREKAAGLLHAALATADELEMAPLAAEATGLLGEL